MRPIELSDNDRRRFEDKFIRDPETDCWLWTLSTFPNGYASFSIKACRYLASRVSYTIFKGPIPAGLTIDHLCRQPRCVNPLHLEAVPMRTNTLRGIGPSARNALKTHCAKGHPLDGENLYVTPKNQRECRICGRAWALNNYYRNRHREMERRRRARLAASA